MDKETTRPEMSREDRTNAIGNIMLSNLTANMADPDAYDDMVEKRTAESNAKFPGRGKSFDPPELNPDGSLADAQE